MKEGELNTFGEAGSRFESRCSQNLIFLYKIKAACSSNSKRGVLKMFCGLAVSIQAYESQL